ncbi:MAG: type IX secretion system membrane protein PorP/SprF [Sporocytophaga sp.]|uniref:type IX secretion system membrane protein PorP/SprF n=1 Tax=Sporocytophaga sp. TaxID=2231183 RepID=UPI001B153913|nr:type IX secretion system membrane protein PorP/SprF [Sporocytophaga sp.]MBO9699044.1 type IX secretion system membrane protein PorP/SprF [Sporocytophaga sp.]
MQTSRLVSLLLILLSLLPGQAKSQSAGGSFLTFDQFFQNYAMFNPASEDTSGKFNLRIGNSALYGLFEGVNRRYLDLDFKPGNRKSLSYSKIGALIQTNNDGPFIKRSRYYARYSRTIAIGREQYVSLGLALGAVSLTLNGSQSVGGGTSTAFDGYAGMWYHWRKLKLGASVEQFTQSVLTPIQQNFKLSPVLNFNGIYSFDLSPQISMYNHLYFRKESGNPGSLEYAPVLLMAEVIEAGANFKFKRGIAILLGINAHTLDYGTISFMGSFLIGTRQLSTSADNKFEITARYSY